MYWPQNQFEVTATSTQGTHYCKDIIIVDKDNVTKQEGENEGLN